MKHLRLVPLFLVVLICLVFIPQINQVHAPTSITFKSFCHNSINTGTTINCTLTGVSTSDSIIVNIFGIGVFNAFTVTDGQSNSYSQKILSLTGSGSGTSTYIQTTLATASGGSLIVTVSTGGANRAYGFTASDYSGVTGFGKTGTDQQDSAGNSGTSTVTLTGTSSSSLMIDDIYLDGSGATFTLTQNNGQSIRDSGTAGASPCGAGNNCDASDSTSPTLGWSWSGGSNCTPCSVSHSSLEMIGSQNAQQAVAQCYGNCGNPPITIVNTNSTHSINFNQSITLFYEFQSNLNGFIQNYTTNYASICGSGSKCTANTLFTALYTIQSCPLGNTPFSVQCPGSRVSSASTTPPTKQRFSAVASNVQVYIGQWIAVAVSASFSGSDINDTNTNVPLFQTNGITPPIITSSTSASSLCAGCKMGLWVWITGNVVIGQPQPPSTQVCINSDLACFLFVSACGLTPSNCFIGGAMILMIYFVIFVISIVLATSYINREYDMQVQFPPSLFFLFFLLELFIFTAIGLVPQYITIVIFILTGLGVAGYFGSGFMGRGKSE